MRPDHVFIDAAGTLIHVCEPVGAVYARGAAAMGIRASEAEMTDAFRSAWKLTMPPQPRGEPSLDDDRGWWRALVRRVFEAASSAEQISQIDVAQFDEVFDRLYEHYASSTAWAVFADVGPALERLQTAGCRLWVVSNFDKRLHRILTGHGLDGYFEGMVISSEVGAAKPHRRIFEAALRMAKAQAQQSVHIGDDAVADVEGASAMGIRAMLVQRPGRDLRVIADELLG